MSMGAGLIIRNAGGLQSFQIQKLVESRGAHGSNIVRLMLRVNAPIIRFGASHLHIANPARAPVFSRPFMAGGG
jgi:hypothetical protein